MQLSDKLRAEILSVIQEKINLDNVRSVSIESVEVNEELEEIRIAIVITTTSDARPLADDYFGLTRRVRNALGAEWKNFFPVISPVIDRQAYA